MTSSSSSPRAWSPRRRSRTRRRSTRLSSPATRPPSRLDAQTARGAPGSSSIRPLTGSTSTRADAPRFASGSPGRRASPSERFVGLGARHGAAASTRPAASSSSAPTALHRPRLPARHARRGRHPAGRLRAGAVAALGARLGGVDRDRRRTALRFELGDEAVVSHARRRRAAARAPVHATRRPAARLRAFLRADRAARRCCPSGPTGTGRAATSTSTSDDAEADFDGYREHDLPLDAIVLDSPVGDAIQHVGVQPAPVPGRAGDDRARCAPTACGPWCGSTPWVNLDSRDGQYPPDAVSARCTASRRPTTRPGPALRPRRATASRSSRAGGWATGSPVDFTSPAAEAWWREQAKRVLRLGVEGIKADDGEGWYLPDDVRFADGTTGAQAAWAPRARYRRSMQRALDEVHPGEGRAVRARGWTGQQAVGITWGGDQPSDFWSLRTLVAATLTAAASRLLELVARRRRLPRRAARRALPEGAAAALGAVRLLHAADAGARALRAGGVDLRRGDARRLPRLRAAARAARALRPRRGGDRGAQRAADHPPAGLTDPADARGWSIADAYGYGPSLWVAPVLEDGARERRGRPPARRLDRRLDRRERSPAAARSSRPRRWTASRSGSGAAR